MKTAKYIIEEFILPICIGLLAALMIGGAFKILYKLIEIWRV